MVEQYEITESGEAMREDFDDRNIAEMQQMLTAEIAKLREVEGGGWASADISSMRVSAELRHLGHHAENRQVVALILDMVEPYTGEAEVDSFLGNVRKNMMQENHRMAARRHNVTPWDDEAPIVLEALGLADRLIARHPEDATRLHEIREQLREYLEHN